ncbi:MAG: uroporphyrinogen-III synthase [Gemmobacter sp.]|uniref:uroporphyrinogen-III synthase n=1 Tax=Gemmobacter sp. TaxID=1898957 RepID=UPI001A38181D|nr:uroporphyrinogen-III synthase [Gemmobacter sp.]MBL8562803.1 uroporphyrinogen-III synthase [Gemmobacter sp.]
MVIQSIPTLIVTRPEPGGAAFAARLGQPAILSPLMAPEFLAPPLPPARALILTSATAVEGLRRLGEPLPPLAFCVGDATAQAAQALGLQTESAAGDAEALLGLLLARRPEGPLLHVCGTKTRGNLAARLGAAGLPCTKCVIYDQRPRPLVPEAVAALHGPGPVILPVFSPRSAALLAAELARVGATAPLWVAAISEAAAAPLRGRAARLVIAPQPEARAMAAEVARFFAAP